MKDVFPKISKINLGGYEKVVDLRKNRSYMEKLTMQEEEAMLAAWKTGEGSVKTFLENMGEPKPPYTTVASTIKNLEKKGFLKSVLIGNAYLYKPGVTEEEYKKKFMNGFVKDYFDNSYKELVNFFVVQKKLSAKELKEIIELIEDRKT
jgi:BlaI family penicillinase repressor